MSKLSYKTLLIIFLSLLIAIVVLWKFVLPKQQIKAAWWNDGWNYRQAINISSHTSLESNVYIITSVNIGTTTKAQIDDGDFRFIDQSGQTLDYYIASGVGTTNLTFHILIPSFPSGAQTVYVYYGNSTIENGFSDSDFTTQATNYTIGSLSAEEVGGGPIAYWKFDEGVGTTAYDSAGNNNGTISGATWQNESQCISGKCLNINTSGSVNIGNPPGFRINNNAITIETWVKFNFLDYTNNTGKLIGFIGKGSPDTAPGTPSTGFWFGYDNRNNKNSFAYTCFGNSAGGWSGGNNNFNGYNYTFNTNTWYHLAITISNNEGRLYINGKQIGVTKTFSGLQLNNTNNNLYLGNLQGSYGMVGNQDEVKIYPYARTANQIKLDYNSRGSLSGSSANLGVQSNTAPSLKSSLVAYWKFDENNGTSVYDSSGNNHTGSFVGTTKPTWQNGKYKSGIGFSGVNDSISLPYQPNFRNAFSVSIWFKRTTDYNQTADIMLLSSPNAWFFYDSYNSGAIRGDVYIDGTRRAGINVPIPFDGNWYHVVYTYDSATHTAKMYKNGKLYQYNDLTSLGLSNYLIDPPTGNLYNLGSNSKGRGIIVDEAKIYNKALTAEEVKQDYNQGSAVSFGSTTQNIGGTTTSLEYCIPGDTNYCASPVAEWNFEENTGTVAKDTSGNNLNGSLAGNPAWGGQCHKGSCLTLDHIDNRMTVNHSSILEPASITIGGWVKLNNINDRHVLFTKWNGYSIEVNSSGYPYFRTYNGSQQDLTSNKNIVWGKWHYISATFDDTTKQKNIYLDGINVGTTTVTNSIAYSQGVFAIPYSSGLMASGLVDDVRIYNYARTPAQIAYDYNKGAPIGWWKMDECQGNTAYDWSGNNNNGTINIGASGTQTSIGSCTDNLSTSAWNNGKTGKTNSSLNFDGADDKITINDPGTNSSLDANGKNLTLSAWIKGNNFTSQYNAIIVKKTVAPYELWAYTNDLMCGFIIDGTSYRKTYNADFNIGTWYHTVCSYDGNTIKAYVNGVLRQSWTQNGTIITDSNNPLYLGWSGYSNEYFNGQIDDVRIYNYALTNEQVKTLYNGGAINFN